MQIDADGESCRGAGARGFTRVDLVAVLGIGLVLGGVSTASMGSAKGGQRAAACWRNGAELMRAWSAFAADNDGTLPGGIHGGLSQNPTRLDFGNASSQSMQAIQPWAQGWMDYGASSHNTNAAHVSSKAYSSLAVYYGDGRNIVKCPNDRALSDAQRERGWGQRVRTYSGNIAIGPGNGGPGDGPWSNHFQKVKYLAQVRPEQYMFLEEHPDSVNDTAFFSPSGDLGNLSITDVPGSFHAGSTMVTFVDGHVDFRKWASAGLRNLPVTLGALVDSYAAIAGDPEVQKDLKFFYDRTPQVSAP